MALPMSFTPGWQNRLRMEKESLFRIIDLTISVAASKWPDDLKQRRPHLVDKLFSSPPTGDHDDIHSAAGNKRPVSSSSIGASQKESTVSVLRDKEATRKGAQKTVPEKRPLKTMVVQKRDEEKAKPSSSSSSTHGLESERREACSIKKLKDRYREEEARKRKIQVIEFQKGSIAPPCSTSSKKPRKYF